MLANLGDAISKKGFLTEAIRAASGSLAIRVKVLGDHVDTVGSYQAIARLMLRSGQYDRSVAFGRSALEVLARIKSDGENKRTEDASLHCIRALEEEISGVIEEAQGLSRSRPSPDKLLSPHPYGTL